jgi:hypothetical protein
MTHEEFGEMRRTFLRAALEAAEAEGCPSSWVRLSRVAETLGADVSGDAGPVLTARYADMARYYRDTGDITGLRDSEGFRLTAQGIAAAKGE